MAVAFRGLEGRPERRANNSAVDTRGVRVLPPAILLRHLQQRYGKMQNINFLGKRGATSHALTRERSSRSLAGTFREYGTEELLVLHEKLAPP